MLLAAGFARRYGDDKRFALLPDGRCLLQASVENALGSGLPVRVCLRPDDERGKALLTQAGATGLRCAHAAGGMGNTIADGVRQLPAWEGILLALADMPFVSPDTYRALAGLLSPGAICYPRHRGRRGHPVGFGRDYFGELQRLGGDTGARELLRAHAAAAVALDTADSGVLRDIDCPADLQAR